ncbi:MAG: GxxExxY protein [Bacteroidaceae bacterium]|nr:GxxExxY protein [Bacteroidaceae bacterium]
MNIEELIKQVIQCAYNVRMKLSAGFLESVYLNALLIELHDNGLKANKEVPIIVNYKNHTVGEFRADIVVENSVIIELKATQHLTPTHEAQLVNYLTATNIEHGLLINFGSEKIEIKRKYKTFKNTKQ